MEKKLYELLQSAELSQVVVIRSVQKRKSPVRLTDRAQDVACAEKLRGVELQPPMTAVCTCSLSLGLA